MRPGKKSIIFAALFLIVSLFLTTGILFAWPPGSPAYDVCDRSINDTDYDPYETDSSNCGGGPTQEEIDAALAAYAAEIGCSVEDLNEEQKAKALEIARLNVNTSGGEAGSVENSAAPGDPVLATTGKYVLTEDDFTIPGSSFVIGRKYISEAAITGSLGTGWLASFDSRIIRGISQIDEESIRKIQELVDEIYAIYKQIVTEYIAVSVYNNSYLPALESLRGLQEEKAKGEALAALNEYVRFFGTPSYYENTGNGTLTLIDGSGTPKVFEPQGGGEWLHASNPERLYERLVTRDGGGAESTAGFIYYGRGGVIKEYDGGGLLVKVRELNGEAVEIRRSDTGKITGVAAPHGITYTVDYR